MSPESPTKLLSEERRKSCPALSPEGLSNDVDLEPRPGRGCREGKVRRGMLEGRRLEFESGILGGNGAV